MNLKAIRIAKSVMTAVIISATCGMGSAYGQTAVVNKIIETGKTDNHVMDHFDVLTNRIGGRPIGSDAYNNATEWMLQEYKKWGIEAHLEEAGEVPVGFNRGGWWGKLLGADQAMTLHFATPSYTSGTHGIQRGHVLLEPNTQDEFNRMKHSLKGAWVLVNGQSEGWPIGSRSSDSLRAAVKAENAEILAYNNDLRRNPQEGKTAKELRKIPGLFYNEMIEAGVLGFVQRASVPIRALYDRVNINNGSLTFDNLPAVPDIKLDENQFDVIKKMAEERRDIQLEFDIRNYFKVGPVKYHNVVASIKGSKYPDEYVIISGHLDSYDVATGAVDCGTGIGPMMEAARLLAMSGAKPKRTILFVAFAGEEFGLLGAQAFAKTHEKELDKIANLFNRDGGPTPPVGISVPKAMYDDFVNICKPLENMNPEIPFKVELVGPRNKPTKLGGTDASVFAMKGIPAINFTEQDIKGYNFNYGEIWHTERDIYNKEIPEYQEHTAIVEAVVALGVANLDKQLSREGLYSE